LESINEAITLDLPVCVYENTGADSYIRSKYRQAKRVPLASELETYQALLDGQCELTLAYYQNWLGFESQKAYNPNCDLEWVGRIVKSIQSGFANSADVGIKCTSLIGSVLNIYLNDMLESGVIEDMWESYYDKSRDINCDANAPQFLTTEKQEPSTRQRRRSLTSPEDPTMPAFAARHRHRRQLQQQQRRNLLGGGRGGSADDAAAVFDGANDGSQMTINQMAGTFILHYWVTAVAIVVDYLSRYHRRKKKHRQEELEQQEQSSSRRGLDHSESSNNPYSVLYRRSQWLSRRCRSSTLRSTGRSQKTSSSSLHAGNITATTCAVVAGYASSSGQENISGQKQRLYPSRSISFSGDVEIIGEKDDDYEGGQEDTNFSSSLSSSEEMWKRTQEELLDTKTELRETKKDVQDTRREMMEQMESLQVAGREMREQMEAILKLLRDGKE
jgi:hypothetical protein